MITKQKNLGAINLFELIKLKSLLEINNETSIFFSLSTIIFKEMERIKQS